MKIIKTTLVIALVGCSSIALAQADQNKLKTQSINEVGVTVSSYKYTEPNLTDSTGTAMSVSMKGIDYGIEYQGTLALVIPPYLTEPKSRIN
jgi:uncharacterized OsmC-like protein